MQATDVVRDFRGPAIPSLATRVSRDAIVDAEAVRTGVGELLKDLVAWKDRSTYAEVLQEWQLLWHILARFGTMIGE